MTFLHGLKQWLSLGLLVSPCFLGFFCTAPLAPQDFIIVGLSVAEMPGQEGPSRAPLKFDSEFANEKGKYMRKKTYIYIYIYIPFYEYKGHHHLSSIMFQVCF